DKHEVANVAWPSVELTNIDQTFHQIAAPQILSQFRKLRDALLDLDAGIIHFPVEFLLLRDIALFDLPLSGFFAKGIRKICCATLNEVPAVKAFNQHDVKIHL